LIRTKTSKAWPFNEYQFVAEIKPVDTKENQEDENQDADILDPKIKQMTKEHTIKEFFNQDLNVGQ
jgi:hypothetical protein